MKIIGDRVKHDRMLDGIYQGTYKHGPVNVRVKIKIEHRKIVEIELLKHDNWKGKAAEKVIPNRIIEQQSTNVKADTGANVSSRVIMNAVQLAVEGAM